MHNASCIATPQEAPAGDQPALQQGIVSPTCLLLKASSTKEQRSK
jgi:hypothetical protein